MKRQLMQIITIATLSEISNQHDIAEFGFPHEGEFLAVFGPAIREEFFFRQALESLRVAAFNWLSPYAVGPIPVSHRFAVWCPTKRSVENRSARNVKERDGLTAFNRQDGKLRP